MEQAAQQKFYKIGLKDNSKRAKWIINVFWAMCFLNLIAIASGFFEFQLLDSIRDGAIVSDEEANANDLRQGIIGFLQSGLYIASIILFLNWFRRAYGNLHRIGVKHLEYSESMAVWSFFIPVVCLFWPYKIAKEIAVKTRRKVKEIDPDYKSSMNFSIIGLWWALFLITNYLGQFALQSVLKMDTLDQLINSTQAYIFSDLIDIPAAIVTILMIRQIARDEQELYEKLNSTSMIDKEIPANS